MYYYKMLLPSNIYTSLHFIFCIFLFLAVFFTDYRYIKYLLFTLIYVCFLWFTYGCFLKDYESFIKCKYENQPEECEKSNTNTEFYRINSYENTIWWNTILLLIIISIFRYIYQYNFIPFNYNISLKLFIASLTILFILLLWTALEHYKHYKNNKIFILYIMTVIIIITINIFYFFYQ